MIAPRVREHSRGWSRDKMRITTPTEHIKTDNYKVYSTHIPFQTTITFFNQHTYPSTTSVSNTLEGGTHQKWKKQPLKGSTSNQPKQHEGIAVEADLETPLKKPNRSDCPIHLNPQTATFNDIALHAQLRQRLQNGTIEKHLRYARYMETHKIPIDFRHPTLTNFIQHMDYREQIEHATPYALEHEWQAMQMFLRAYGIKKWCYKPPSKPQSHKRILPYPDIVHKFFTYKYTTNKYETALYQYLFYFGFMIGLRIPSELIQLTIHDITFETKHRGYITITETKKHHSQRTLIPEKAILTSPVHKSFKNWLTSWRPKVANHHSHDALFLQPDGKPFTTRHLGHKLSKHGKKIWKPFQPYDMRHWCAVARLTRIKNETGTFDCYPIKNWLGHERMATTEGYLRYAEQYYRTLPVDWITHALKPALNQKK